MRDAASLARTRAMLVTALGDEIVAALDDPSVVEIMINPDGRLWVERHGPLIEIGACAPSFLHHQVRSMTGCLVLVGLGRWPEARVADALAARDRQALGLNAPAHGLYFVAAKYPDEA